MEPKTVEEQTAEEDSDEVDTGTTATDRNVDSMAYSEETITIGNDGLLPVEDSYKNFMVAKYNKEPAGEPNETGAIKDHDMKMDQESHETSTTADHNTHLTEEPVKTSTTADHEKKPATEPGETSNTADLGTNPVGSPNNQKIGFKPFNLLGCPDNALQQILRCVLVSDDQITPYWNFGALESGLEKSNKKNFTTILVAFAGNKKLIDEATLILYGENTFNLQRPKVSLWWLKHIGSNNVSRIKNLIISVDEGVMDCFGTRNENLWYSIFLLLKAQHKLQCLEVCFLNWTDRIIDNDHHHNERHNNGRNPRTDKVVWAPRRRILTTLLSFRGLVKASIWPGSMVNQYCTDLVQDAIVMEPGQTDQDIINLEQDLEVPEGPEYFF